MTTNAKQCQVCKLGNSPDAMEAAANQKTEGLEFPSIKDPISGGGGGLSCSAAAQVGWKDLS